MLYIIFNVLHSRITIYGIFNIYIIIINALLIILKIN